MKITLKEIEQTFQLATAIDFFTTKNYIKTPPTISLIFEMKDIKSNRPEIIYGSIFSYFNDKEKPTFIIRKESGLIHLSIVDKLTANSINCYNLKYDIKQLNEFEKEINKDWGIVFIVGHYTKEGAIAIGRVEDYLVCRGYSITG